jgi:hypothetical protein
VKIGIFIIVGVLLLLAAAGAFEAWRISRLPPQPAHRTTARVESIKAIDSKVRFGGDWIFVRNDHGFGQFSMPGPDVTCEVGDQVPVLQRGVTLTRLPETCRQHPNTR